MQSKRKTYTSFAKLLFFTALMVFSFAGKSFSQSINYRSQSLFIYKFTKYIYWPENKTSSNFVIGVYGNSPIFNELTTMASIKKAGKGQKIEVKKIRSPHEIKDMHLVYITSSKSREVKQVAEQVKGKPVLVVAERGGLAKKGASINFMIMENNMLRFEINMNELKKHNLDIDDELLKLGYTVG